MSTLPRLLAWRKANPDRARASNRRCAARQSMLLRGETLQKKVRELLARGAYHANILQLVREELDADLAKRGGR